ncbi:MAG TPA: replication-relaxation family protein [Solirubrobacteraceae bacterium]|nr:replication-relaxation family protein [Solirubrobacteraceae bacterium]
MLRLLLWRILGLVAFVAAVALIAWLLDGGLGAALRGTGARDAGHLSIAGLASAAGAGARAGLRWAAGGASGIRPLAELALPVAALVVGARGWARHGRAYVRLEVEAYRADTTSAEGVVAMFQSLHKRLLRRWWRRLLWGQPSVALEVHHGDRGLASRGAAHELRLAVSCLSGLEGMVETALRGAYPNCRLRRVQYQLGAPPVVLRLKKQAGFIRRVKTLDRFEHAREPPMNRLMSVIAACEEPAFVQFALTPAPVLFELHAKRLYKRHEAQLSRERREHLVMHDRSIVEDAELRGGLDVQHRPLFFADLRVIAPSRATCERIASELRAVGAENQLVERGTAVRHGLLGLYDARIQRGEGNPLPSLHKGVFASTELAALWQLPSVDFVAVPFARMGLPRAPAPPAILRPGDGLGTLRDALGAVTIHPQLRKQNTAVPGAVEQGKSSYLVATVAEDLRRERCAVIVLDPKGDAAEAAVSLVPASRTCTLLDFAHPTCGFNPLAVNAPADVIADYVVAALKNLFTDADIRASSDRYLRNAIIAVLAYDRQSTLWDAARLLSVAEEGYSYRNAVGARVRTMPEFKEISEFFTAELSAQLADARSTTTAKLDAPVNKLARLLNSPSIKRVLLNDSLRVDFDQAIAGEQVLVVKGALGAMGAGNTSVLMQLLVGMLDAALARQQDLVPAERRVAVALKVDEAPLVLNRGFAETMALKRSAGLETVACWQADAQWSDRDVRAQLDALFAHRVYFATSSSRDARSAVELTMAEFSDTVRPGIERISTLGRPDARLHLPKHHAIVSWLTPLGRQAPFVAETIPLCVDRERLLLHAARQAERGGRHRSDLRQPHWDRRHRGSARASSGPPAAAEEENRPLARPLPSRPSDSFRELVELDRAHSVRWARPAPQRRALAPEPLDLEALALIASLRHVLTSQIHRRFNAGRAVTTTQRRLKRLSDAGLVERFQFHRRDGGGVPMCYVITELGLELLRANERLEGSVEGDRNLGVVNRAAAESPREVVTSKMSGGERRLRQARHDVHVAGWVLALERMLGGRDTIVRGPAECALYPPLHAGPGGRVAIGPNELRLPNGRTPHGFLRTGADGERIEIERFETVRPDAIVELGVVAGEGASRPQARARTATESVQVRSGATAHDLQATGGAASRTEAIDVMVEFDDRLAPGPVTGKLERYDHFIAGWSVHTRRYGSQRRVRPLIVFVCRDRARARECARRADTVLGACRAYAGEYPFDWEYPGREAIVFASERDAHEGHGYAYGVPRLPPEVRVSAAHGDPRAGRATAQERDIGPAIEEATDCPR